VLSAYAAPLAVWETASASRRRTFGRTDFDPVAVPSRGQVLVSPCWRYADVGAIGHSCADATRCRSDNTSMPR
jgi:hypothetical protein